MEPARPTENTLGRLDLILYAPMLLNFGVPCIRTFRFSFMLVTGKSVEAISPFGTRVGVGKS